MAHRPKACILTRKEGLVVGEKAAELGPRGGSERGRSPLRVGPQEADLVLLKVVRLGARQDAQISPKIA